MILSLRSPRSDPADSPQVGVTGSVEAAPAGAIGFDTDTKLTAETAAAFVNAGFRFAVRYVSLGDEEESGDLTVSEVQQILGAGLALSAVQHPPQSGWSPTEQLGIEYGRNATYNAQAAGLPTKLNLWLDLEGISSETSASDVSIYCNAWFDVVRAADYVPGLYVGANIILDSAQLDSLSVEYFWKSGSGAGSRLPGSCFEYPSPAKGYCIVQRISGTAELEGVSFDGDVTKTNNTGQTLFWLTGKQTSNSAGSEDAEPTPESQPSGDQSRPLLRNALIALVAILIYAAGVITGQPALEWLKSIWGQYATAHGL